MQAPAAPDPYKTAAAQTASNKETAVAQTGLNAINQITPYGNLTYSQNGKWSDGTPKFTATQTFSPSQQALYDKSTKLSGNLADLGVSQSARLAQLLSQPSKLDSIVNKDMGNFTLDNAATEGRLIELGRQRLDPLWDQNKKSYEQDLFNRGVRPGSEAYETAMSRFGQDKNDAYNSLLLSGRQQASNELLAQRGQQMSERQQSINEALTQRNQPINEILGLASGTQIQQPQFQATPQSGVAPTDVTTPIMQNYQSQLQQYNAGMSGLFGLGSAALGGWMMSDRRLKEDVTKVGETPDGIPVKTFRYKGSPLIQLGMMAQDVEKKRPEAVRTTPSGYKAVNYPAAVA